GSHHPGSGVVREHRAARAGRLTVDLLPALGPHPADEALSLLDGQRDHESRRFLRLLGAGQDDLRQTTAVSSAQIQPGATAPRRPAPPLGFGLGFAQLAREQAAQDGPHSALDSEIQSSRSRGPSNSQRKIACQRPSLSSPPVTGTAALLPTSIVWMWESLLPSVCRNAFPWGTSSRRWPIASEATAGSQPSLTVTPQVVCGE